MNNADVGYQDYWDVDSAGCERFPDEPEFDEPSRELVPVVCKEAA